MSFSALGQRLVQGAPARARPGVVISIHIRDLDSNGWPRNRLAACLLSYSDPHVDVGMLNCMLQALTESCCAGVRNACCENAFCFDSILTRARRNS